MVNSECSHGFIKRPLALVYAAMALKNPLTLTQKARSIWRIWWFCGIMMMYFIWNYIKTFQICINKHVLFDAHQLPIPFMSLATRYVYVLPKNVCILRVWFKWVVGCQYFFPCSLTRPLLFALPDFSQCGKLVGNIGDAVLVSATNVHFNAVIAFRFT